jgi:hypothetical protein
LATSPGLHGTAEALRATAGQHPSDTNITSPAEDRQYDPDNVLEGAEDLEEPQQVVAEEDVEVGCGDWPNLNNRDGSIISVEEELVIDFTDAGRVAEPSTPVDASNDGPVLATIPASEADLAVAHLVKTGFNTHLMEVQEVAPEVLVQQAQMKQRIDLAWDNAFAASDGQDEGIPPIRQLVVPFLKGARTPDDALNSRRLL